MLFGLTWFSNGRKENSARVAYNTRGSLIPEKALRVFYSSSVKLCSRLFVRPQKFIASRLHEPLAPSRISRSVGEFKWKREDRELFIQRKSCILVINLLKTKVQSAYWEKNEFFARIIQSQPLKSVTFCKM